MNEAVEASLVLEVESVLRVAFEATVQETLAQSQRRAGLIAARVLAAKEARGAAERDALQRSEARVANLEIELRLTKKAFEAEIARLVARHEDERRAERQQWGEAEAARRRAEEERSLAAAEACSDSDRESATVCASVDRREEVAERLQPQVDQVEEDPERFAEWHRAALLHPSHFF